MAMIDIAIRKTVFLDTNVLHFVGLYLGEARRRDLFPFSKGTIVAARKVLDDINEENLKKVLTKGFNLVRKLRSTQNYNVEYSPMCEIELIVGRARGKAIRNAASRGIPERMWTRFYEREISSELEQNDFADIRAKADELSTTLAEVGVRNTDGERTRDVFEIARSVVGLVYMGTLDSVVYAGALAVEADHLISADDYLKQTVNGLSKANPPFDSRARQLRERIAEILLKEPSDVTLPDAPNWLG